MNKIAPSMCVRCNCGITPDSGLVGSLCSSCDEELQHMHHACEYIVDKKIVYLDQRDVRWYEGHGIELRKPPQPRRRDFYGKTKASRPTQRLVKNTKPHGDRRYANGRE